MIHGGQHMPPVEQALFVRIGLARFAARRDIDLSAVLEAEYLSEIATQSWASLCDKMQRNAGQGRLDRMVADLGLGVAEHFLLSLLVAVEQDWRIGAAVRLLQAPRGDTGAVHDPRPTLHLVEALTAELFSTPIQPLAFVTKALTTCGAEQVLGDGPMPFRRIALPPPLAAILSGGPPLWPGTEPVAVDPDAPVNDGTARALEMLTPQMASGEAGFLAIRGAASNGRPAAAELARRLGLSALAVPEAQWRGDAALRLAVRYAEILPVIRLALAPGERWTPPPLLRPVPVVYLLGTEGGIAAEAGEALILDPPDRATREALWSAYAGPDVARRLATSAGLDETTIRTLGAAAARAAARQGRAVDPELVMDARRATGAEGLARLAQPVVRLAGAEALILSDAMRRRFDRMLERCEGREDAARGLGPALEGVNRLGVCALFAGPSGAGKTFAASHLAERLAMPLWRVDLSAVMNKYIGETEKNLSAALDEAESLDVALLLDEADALFGRRSDGEGEGERYANMVTNFLLTRLERHRGITILTTNARSRIDPAFTRRFDFIFDFPLPGPEERLAIWRAHLGDRAPDSDSCLMLASECDLPGGFVRTIALNAAAAVPDGGVIPLSVLAELALEEYHKLGRSVPAVIARIAANG